MMSMVCENGLPRHVAIIMDGNGRWAQQRGQPRVAGHRAGAKAVNRTVTMCRELGIDVLTLYAFSEQNWSRPTHEVTALMRLLLDYVRKERRQILDNDIRLLTIGETSRLPAWVRFPLAELKRASARNRGMSLVLALSYGGREDIVEATRTVARRVAAGELAPDDIDEAAMTAALSTHGMPDPDLLIRTSGELRVSNFLLWQLAYTELYFADVHWPDFGREHLTAALANYRRRQRRFGLVGEQVTQLDSIDPAEISETELQTRRAAKC